MKPAGKKTGRLILILLLISLFWPFVLSTPVHADFGPKPSITITVKNPPSEEYYLDLLIPEEKVNNSLSDRRDEYDPVKFSLLEQYRADVLVLSLTHGTQIPLFGKLTGTRRGADMVHAFSYFGTPERFKIILITPDNRIVVSEELTRQTFQLQLTYDFATGQVDQRPLWLTYVIQILSTLIPTLVIEGALLLLFGFSWKKSRLPFLIVNLVTQVILTATLGTAAITAGMFTAYFLAVPLELLILVAESIAFAKLLKEHTRGRRVAYAITANITSLAASLLLMSRFIG